VEKLADYLQSYAHLHFSLALVELALYRLPQLEQDQLLVQPRIIARTVEIPRGTFTIVDGKPEPVLVPDKDAISPKPRPTRLSVESFIDTMKSADSAKAALRSFVEACERLGLEPEVAAYLHLKLRGQYNFGSFHRDGTFANFSIVSKLNQEGLREIGISYLRQLAALIPEAIVKETRNEFEWSVRRNDGHYLELVEMMKVARPWLDLIERTIRQIDEAHEQQHALEHGA
jgi:hypothetical protein